MMLSMKLCNRKAVMRILWLINTPGAGVSYLLLTNRQFQMEDVGARPRLPCLPDNNAGASYELRREFIGKICDRRFSIVLMFQRIIASFRRKLE